VPRHVKNEKAPEVPLPIIPMLDMTFQLLAFFIMTYHPSEVSEGSVEFTLPSSGVAMTKDNDPDPTAISEKDMAGVAHITLEVQTGQGSNKGSIVNIIVQEAASGGGYACTTVEALGKYLKQKHDEINPTKKAARDETTDIKITMASKLKHAEAMKILDACLNVGQFTKVSFAPPTE
jgi:biopolymer transport protein ExbD